MDDVQRFDIRHAKALGELNKQLIEDEGHSNSMSALELTERMTQWLQNGYFCYGIAREGRLVAYALYRDDGEYFYLRQLFTTRNYRNQGFASTLLEHLQAEIFSEKPLRVEVLAANASAFEFYRNRGFEMYCHTLVRCP